MKRIFFGMVTLALLFVSCEKPVVQESTMTHETDSQWKNLGTPDTIKTEPLAQCQAIFGVGKYLNETFTDICNGDTVRGITFQITAASRSDSMLAVKCSSTMVGKDSFMIAFTTSPISVT